MSLFRTNSIGKAMVGLGVITLAITGVLAFDEATAFTDRATYIAVGIALGAILIGLFVRVVGAVVRLIGLILFLSGGAVLFVSIAHAVLVDWIGWRVPTFGLERDYINELRFNLGAGGLGAAIGGFLLGVIGERLARTTQQERSIATHTARAGGRTAAPVAASVDSGPRCPNCGSSAPGGMLGNRMFDCLTCGGTACASCAGGILGMGAACPHCGESRQEKVQFRDTGASY